MGPQGMSIKRLQAETGCKMSIMGKGSMKDRKKVGGIDTGWLSWSQEPGLILGLHPANERRRYFVTSLIGRAQAYNQPREPYVIILAWSAIYWEHDEGFSHYIKWKLLPVHS